MSLKESIKNLIFELDEVKVKDIMRDESIISELTQLNIILNDFIKVLPKMKSAIVFSLENEKGIVKHKFPDAIKEAIK